MEAGRFLESAPHQKQGACQPPVDLALREKAHGFTGLARTPVGARRVEYPF
jgi:hypothetical protein